MSTEKRKKVKEDKHELCVMCGFKNGLFGKTEDGLCAGCDGDIRKKNISMK